MADQNSVGGVFGGIVASIVMLVFAILSFFLAVFIVDAGAGLADYSPRGGFVVLSAAILAGSAVNAGSAPLAVLGESSGPEE